MGGKAPRVQVKLLIAGTDGERIKRRWQKLNLELTDGVSPSCEREEPKLPLSIAQSASHDESWIHWVFSTDIDVLEWKFEIDFCLEACIGVLEDFCEE
mmetsp:Transcript_1163/g.1853  ORF Transcript_1163/g.1853 Transcript_1163/m.1853 type:complete len:98 (+) Transcript_1163:599-892(+)